MFAIVGLIVLFGCLLGGYTMHGGKIAALIQISEFIIMGGAALGSIIIGFGFKALGSLMKGIMGLMKPNPYNAKAFLDLLEVMYEVFLAARKEGLVALEKHVEEPEKSEILEKYPTFLSNHHAVDLFADTLKLVAMGGVNVYNLSDLMESDLEAHHEESMEASGILQTVGDAMPGFGIVAAVLGIVITMQAIGGPPEVIGYKVAAALVGTFLGVLLAYGVFAPLSKATELRVKSEAQYMNCIKNGVLAFARGDVPLVCVEFARRNIEPVNRPSFKEMEEACKQKNKGGGEAGAKAA